MTKFKVLRIMPGIVTLSHFRLATCSLQKYPEISYYHDNAIMKSFSIMIMNFMIINYSRLSHSTMPRL